MKILVTGAKGFVGRNLCSQLNNIKTGKAKCYGDLQIDEVFEYDLNSTMEQLDAWCSECDFVFNLAGVNRPQNPEEFMSGNFGFASTLLDTLKKHGNKAPVMLSSSAQASLSGRFGNSEYGRSKKAGEDLFLRYGEENGIKVLVYRFPNLYGKWCRPNYNSAIATFCNNIANDLPITVNDRATELELLYIDDLVEEMLDALEGKPHRCDYDGLTPVFHDSGRYCAAPVTHKVTLGEIADLLERFKAQPATLVLPEIPAGSFAKKLYSTYLSYLPKEKKTGRPTKGPFDPDKEIPKNVHRPALDAVFANGNISNYDDYIERLKEGYGLQGIKLGYNKAVKVATLLSDERMVIKEEKDYAFNPEYHY